MRCSDPFSPVPIFVAMAGEQKQAEMLGPGSDVRLRDDLESRMCVHHNGSGNFVTPGKVIS